MKLAQIFSLGILGLITPPLSAPALAQEEEGYQGLGHAEFHDFYGGLHNSRKGVSCCHDKDCRPTTARHTNNGWEVKINGTWWVVDQDSIMPKAAPDGGAHVCAGDPSQQDPLGRVYCVILPPET